MKLGNFFYLLSRLLSETPKIKLHTSYSSISNYMIAWNIIC